MSQSNETPSPEEEKRPFQFSLRTMFVVTFIWAVLCTIGATFGLAVAFFVAGIGCSFVGVFVCSHDHGRSGALMTSLGLLVMFLAVMLTPMTTQHGRRDPQIYCMNNLKQVGLALHNYADAHGCLPPAYIADASGKPMHSWRVLLLPYLGRNDIYKKYDFDEPWDGPNNSKLHDIVVSEFRCPQEKPTAKKTDTSYVAVVGPNTMFPGKQSLRFSAIGDGSCNTIMFVEVSNSGIHWMEPRDLNIEEMAFTINPPSGKGISSNHRDGVANVVFADGSVHTFTKEGLTAKQLQALLTRNGGEETGY